VQPSGEEARVEGGNGSHRSISRRGSRHVGNVGEPLILGGFLMSGHRSRVTIGSVDRALPPDGRRVAESARPKGQPCQTCYPQSERPAGHGTGNDPSYEARLLGHFLRGASPGFRPEERRLSAKAPPAALPRAASPSTATFASCGHRRRRRFGRRARREGPAGGRSARRDADRALERDAGPCRPSLLLF
jgi:hypothetical protein